MNKLFIKIVIRIIAIRPVYQYAPIVIQFLNTGISLKNIEKLYLNTDKNRKKEKYI